MSSLTGQAKAHERGQLRALGLLPGQSTHSYSFISCAVLQTNTHGLPVNTKMLPYNFLFHRAIAANLPCLLHHGPQGTRNSEQRASGH